MSAHTDRLHTRTTNNPNVMKQKLTLPLALLALVTTLPATAVAQQPPDAGRTLQQLLPAPTLPAPSPELGIQVPALGKALPGGAKVTVQSVNISGNSMFKQAALVQALGEVVGKAYDLAGLKELANQVSNYYRSHGYPFATAYLPPQKLTDGAVHIEVVEGRYGQIKAGGDEKLAAQAQRFLAPLVPGQVIASRSLERTALLLSDLPGLKSSPLMRPGQSPGTGDLDVRVSRGERFGGELGVDNYGNFYTGQVRGHLNLLANSLITLGDQLTTSGMYSDQDLANGSANYSLPVGSSGLRAQVGYAYTYYQLGKEFAALDANGTAQVITGGLSYPVIRSQSTNLAVTGLYQHKILRDNQDTVDTSNGKYSDSLPLAVNFDVRDSLLGGAVTYGSFGWRHGILNLNSDLKAIDQMTARTDGHFDKFNFDLARLQSLPAHFTLFGRLSAQLANDNLDSSEAFGLGGVNGVRAYPSGEGFGDEGWLGQIELRYTVKAFTPYTFYDGGQVAIKSHPFASGTNSRSVSGTGVGLRASYLGLSADANVAWRTVGGIQQSDTQNRDPQFWLGTSYRF